MPRPEKVKAVSELKEKITEAKSVLLTDFKGLDPELVKEAKKALQKEWKELLGLCGASTISVGGSWTGSDEYQPDGVDDTNIHWTDESSEGYSRHA